MDTVEISFDKDKKVSLVLNETGDSHISSEEVIINVNNVDSDLGCQLAGWLEMNSNVSITGTADISYAKSVIWFLSKWMFYSLHPFISITDILFEQINNDFYQVIRKGSVKNHEHDW